MINSLFVVLFIMICGVTISHAKIGDCVLDETVLVRCVNGVPTNRPCWDVHNTTIHSDKGQLRCLNVTTKAFAIEPSGSMIIPNEPIRMSGSGSFWMMFRVRFDRPWDINSVEVYSIVSSWKILDAGFLFIDWIGTCSHAYPSKSESGKMVKLVSDDDSNSLFVMKTESGIPTNNCKGEAGEILRIQGSLNQELTNIDVRRYLFKGFHVDYSVMR